MFLKNVIRFGVSKVLLLLVAIWQLLGKVGPKWTLFLEVPSVCVDSPEAVVLFPFQLNLFQFVPKIEMKYKKCKMSSEYITYAALFGSRSICELSRLSNKGWFHEYLHDHGSFKFQVCSSSHAHNKKIIGPFHT